MSGLVIVPMSFLNMEGSCKGVSCKDDKELCDIGMEDGENPSWLNAYSISRVYFLWEMKMPLED